IGLSHSDDGSPDLAAYARASRRGASGESGPVLAEAAALPSQDGVGGHDDESLPPAGPHPGQRDPEQPIAAEQLRPVHQLLVDGELVAQSKVLQGDLTVATTEHREESKQVEQESDHCAEIFAVSAPTDQSLGDGRSFGEGQAIGPSTGTTT